MGAGKTEEGGAGEMVNGVDVLAVTAATGLGTETAVGIVLLLLVVAGAAFREAAFLLVVDC